MKSFEDLPFSRTRDTIGAIRSKAAMCCEFVIN